MTLNRGQATPFRVGEKVIARSYGAVLDVISYMVLGMSGQDIGEKEYAVHGLDIMDLEILRVLQENARISYNEIASKLRVPKPTVYYRVKRLESMGLIKSYSAVLDPEKLGSNI